MRGLEAKRAENDWASRSGASRVVGWPVVFCIAQCVPLAEWAKQPVARGEQSEEKRKGREERKGKGPAKLQAFTPGRLPKPSLLRGGDIFRQRGSIVKRLDALESK